MIASLCLLALAASPSDLKPLPEERKLSDREPIALELTRLDVPKIGSIGWTKTEVQRAQLDGAPHYLVLETAELLDFDTPGLVVMESRGLYDADLKLVHEVRLAEPLGAEAKPLELEWNDEGFRWREGRGKWSAVSATPRPTVKTDVALLVHGLDIETPFQAHVFEEKTKSIESRTLASGVQVDVDGTTMMDFKVDGSTPMRHRLTSKGVYMESKVGDLEIIALDVSDDLELALRRLVADNEAFAAVLAKALPGGWTEKKGTFEHATLGLSFKLPKGWVRAPESEKDGAVFRAYSADSDAYLNLSVSVHGTGYTLDGWKSGLIEYYAQSAAEGKVDSKKASVAKLDALRFEFSTADPSFETVAHAWTRGGFGFALIAGTSKAAPKKVHRAAQGISKSVKFER